MEPGIDYSMPRFMELDRQHSVDETAEYHQLAIKLARETCEYYGWGNVEATEQESNSIIHGTDSGRIKSTPEYESVPNSK